MASTFDPDAPEGSTSRSSYLSFKDVRLILIVLVLLIAILYPVYVMFRRQSEKHLCLQNFQAIGKAFGLYSTQWDDRYPPAFQTESNGSPMLDDRGRANTWATLLRGYLGPRASFRCDTATAAENTVIQHPDFANKSITCSYGLFGAMASRQISLIPTPERTVLMAETANFGAEDSFDPVPYLDATGQPVKSDGFVIGFDNSNTAHNRQTRHVTRLAFFKTANGTFPPKGESRHDKGIHFLFCDGQVGVLKPPIAEVQHIGNDLAGAWSTR